MNNLSYYKELQGVMTRFEPLTETALQNAGTGLTLPEIKVALEQHGLDLRYVVHDPSRSTFATYYADYDRGLYSDLFLQRNMIDKLPLYTAADRLKGGAVSELAWTFLLMRCSRSGTASISGLTTPMGCGCRKF